MDAAEMRAKVARGAQENSNAVTVLYQAKDLLERTIQLWQTVSDKPELVAAITTLQQATDRLDEAIVQITSGNSQAESYASRI